MKQLIHNTPDGQHVIIGLRDTVFYFKYYRVSDKNSSSDCIVHDLVPSVETSAVACGDNDDDEPPPAKETTVLVDPNEVQAVAVVSVDKIAWCAVARYDKTLTLYAVEALEQESAELRKVFPHSIHRSSKRVCSLAFATVYGEIPSHKSITVIVAGDLAGDANAYSLELKDTAESDRLDDAIVTKNRRLLLGHTASMLTCVHIVEDDTTHKQRILTSDRDEKIRISQFPDAYCIEGYLLGHTAFVSSIAVSPKTNRCVSVGGDYTLRLWDYTTCAELAVASTTSKIAENLESNIASESEPTVEGAADQRQPVPSKVAFTTDGNLVLTIYDESRFLDLWMVHEDEKNNFALEHCSRWECPTQPLAVSFLNDTEILVVMREPEYIQQFQVTFEGEFRFGKIKHRNDQNYGALATVKQWCSKGHIVMPVGLLEKDEYGCLKMGKMNERRSGATLKPWNNAARKETNAERVKRLRKRRRDEQIQSKASILDQEQKSINDSID